MNINRLRPMGVKREDLDLWLSSVINDAIRDAREAGLDEASIYHLLKNYAEHNHPYGYKYRSHAMSNTKPATIFDVRSLDNKSKGSVLIADFGAHKNKEPPDFMATLAPPPFVAPPGFRLESVAVRALAEQVRSVLDQLAEIADNLERNGR